MAYHIDAGVQPSVHHPWALWHGEIDAAGCRDPPVVAAAGQGHPSEGLQDCSRCAHKCSRRPSHVRPAAVRPNRLSTGFHANFVIERSVKVHTSKRVDICLRGKGRKAPPCHDHDLSSTLFFPHADILRVGPLRRISRELLPHSLHSTAGKRSEAAHELEAMLKEATSVAEQNVLKDELARVNN